MEQASLTILAGWANFYVIVGSSAGALTGLQFVVMTLIAEKQVASSMREIRAFGTPTVVDFCAALLISAVMSVPWRSLSDIGFCVGACGVAGVGYTLGSIRHARKSSYTPDTGDWIWYTAVPLAAYAALVTGAILLASSPVSSLFVIAATSLLLLFVGIHNAWDTVTYIALQRREKPKEAK
jgi:hypothetical protein